MKYDRFPQGVWAIVAALAVLTYSATVSADFIELKTGEKLVGKVTSQQDGMVKMDHPILGELTIPLAQISVITRDPDPDVTVAETRELVEGAPLPPAEMAEIRAQVEAELREKIREEVKQEMAAAAAKKEEPIDPYKDLPPELRAVMLTLREWNVSLSLGLSGVQGTTDSISFRVDGKAARADDTGRLSFSANYYHLQSGGSTTQDRANFTTQYDWNFLGPDEPWILWAKGAYDYDITTSWRNRVSGFLGIGYKIFDQDDLQLIARLGPGVTYNFSGGENLRPEVLIGLDLIKWQIARGHTLTGSVSFIPDVSDPQYNRTQAKAEYSMAIPEMPGWKLKAGVTNEYDSITSDNAEHNQFTYYTSLGYDF